MEISVVIPVYNAKKYVRQAAESALQQPETAEVLLIEDNSSDFSLKICHDLQKENPKITLLRHTDGKNHGAGATRNIGIKCAKFDYIAFLDADDYYLPERFQVPKEIFDRFPDVDGVYEAIGVDFSDDQVKKLWAYRYQRNLTTLKEAVGSDQLFEALVRDGKGSLHLDGLVVKKTIFRRCGYFYEHLRLHQDSAMLTKMSVSGKLVSGRLNKPVAMRRIHGENRILRDSNWNTKCLSRETLFLWGLKNNLERPRLSALFYNYIYSLYKSANINEEEIFSIFPPQLRRAVIISLKHPLLFVGAVLRFTSKKWS